MKKSDLLFIFLITSIYIALFIPVFSELKNKALFSCPSRKIKDVSTSIAQTKENIEANSSPKIEADQNLSSFDNNKIKQFIDKNRLSNREALFYK